MTSFTIDKSTKLLFIDADDKWVKAFSILISNDNAYSVVGRLESMPSNVDKILALMPHIVLLNADKLNLDDVGLIKEVKLQSPSIQILPYAEEPSEELVIKCIERGSCGFISSVKSNYKRLSQALNKIHAGEPALSGDLAKILVKKLQRRMDLPLTKKELEVLNELKKGKSSTEVANSLNLATNTIRSHITNIYGKLNVNNRAEAFEKTAS